eukprot:Gb_20923 [translate_table: standard]
MRASFPCPCWAYPVSIAFHETMLWLGNLLNTLLASSMLPHSEYMLIKAFPTDTSVSNADLMMTE